MCDCVVTTSDIKFDGAKFTCPTNTDLTFTVCENMNDVLATIFAALCQPSAFTNTKVPYNTTAAYPVTGGAGSLTIPADGTYYVTGNVTVEAPDGCTVTSAILLNGVEIVATEKPMINSAGVTLYWNISFIYEGVLAENNVIQVGAKDIGPAANVVQSEIYYTRKKA